MNSRHREQRIRQADEARKLAQYNLLRARQALDQIREIAEARPRHDSLSRIALLARSALVDAVLPDPNFTPGEDHGGVKV